MHPSITGAKDRSYWHRGTLPSGVGPELIERLSRAANVHSYGRDMFPVPAPFTLEPLGWAPRGQPSDIFDAASRAREAQRAWADQPFSRRRAILLRFHDLLLARREQALDLIQLESGKARAHALEEVLDTALVARHYALHGEDYLRDRRRPAALPLLTAAWERHVPIGVAGFISPWNFPLILGITDLLPALLAGNGAVLRPDVQAPFTALWAAELLYEAGLPREVLRVVTGPGSILGPPLIDSVDFIMFTGGTATGKLVAKRAAERLIGFCLELGGKNPMIVLPDADLDAAADGLVRGAFVGAGQVCVSIERAYIAAPLLDEFSRKLVDRVRTMKLSAELAYGADMGSLALPGQLATVTAHVEDATRKGAVLLAGGRPRPDLGPLFYEPTVLSGVTPQMTLYRDETFGPVVALYPYTTVEEAIALANDSDFGLNASVWSKNRPAALAVARRIKAGTVNVNEIYAPTWTTTAAPTGGMKQSGFGRRHGAEGVVKYTEAQTIAAQRWFPCGIPPFLSERTYGAWMPRLMRLLRHVPGLR